jgi:hypothetical protein
MGRKNQFWDGFERTMFEEKGTFVTPKNGGGKEGVITISGWCLRRHGRKNGFWGEHIEQDACEVYEERGR